MDFLSGFDLSDTDDARQTTREDRMAKAFEKSKASYRTELVITPPGWFNSDVPVSQRLKVSGPEGSSRALREIEWSIQQLYLQQKYAECLAMSMELLTSIEYSHAKDPAEGKQELRRRETLDVAMRCALKLKDKRAGCELADRSRPSWRVSPGLAHAAGEAYVFGGWPHDAISPLLSAINLRGPLYPFVLSLSEAFRNLEQESDSLEQQDQQQASRLLGELLENYAARLEPAFRKPLFDTQEPEAPRIPRPARIPRASEEDLASAVHSLGLQPEDQTRLIKLCSFEEAEADDEVPRSVRTL